jgi:hypothetical protein
MELELESDDERGGPSAPLSEVIRLPFVLGDVPAPAPKLPNADAVVSGRSGDDAVVGGVGGCARPGPLATTPNVTLAADGRDRWDVGPSSSSSLSASGLLELGLLLLFISSGLWPYLL